MPRDHDRVSALVDRERGDGAVAATVAEEIPTGSMTAFAIRNDHRGEWHLAAGQRQRVHLRIGRGKSDAQKMEQPFQGRPGVGEGLADDEVLHAVGGDDHRVVAVGVGGEEFLAEDLDVDLAGEQVVVAPGE